MVEPKKEISKTTEEEKLQKTAVTGHQVFKDDENIFDQDDHIFRGIDPLDTRPHEQEYLREQKKKK